MHAQIRIVSGNDRWEFGRAQIILRAQNGVLWAGTDGRADGTAIAW
jgi:gamma-glutamyltranspeptidase